MKTYIGIDNGVTGTIGTIWPGPAGGCALDKTPTKTQQDYTKKKKSVTRLNPYLFETLLVKENSFVVIERPMLNPQRWNASLSAIRCHEAMLTIIEFCNIPYQFIDSKEWQRELLPKGCTGPELKKASLDIGRRLFPAIEGKFADYDGLLIAEYARRNGL